MFVELLIVALLNGSVQDAGVASSQGIVGIRDNVISKEINRVFVGSPAYWIGIKPGDKILSFKPNTGKPGEEVTIKVRRGKETLTFLTLREAKASFYTGFSLTKDGVKED